MDVSTIDEFDVGQVLGRGGFGMVHRARHRATGRDVALKIIDKQQMRASGMTERVVNEVTLHSALRHPSIVELLGYFEDSHCVYLVMELCCRGDLYRYLRRQPGGCLQEDEAARLLVQVLSALAYLHHQHIVHRDLKLSNLLLTRELRVKLSDFGLAVRLQSPDEEHYTLCGTPNYIAPEMATAGPHGLPADLWSIGCLFYTLVAGKAPFQGEATSDTLAKASKGHYAMPAGLSTQATDFLQSLLQTDPGHRLSITSVLCHPFIRHHCNDLPPPCSPISIPSPYHHHDDGPGGLKSLQWKQGSSSSTPTQPPSSISPSSSTSRSRQHDSLATIPFTVPVMEPLSQHTTADVNPCPRASAATPPAVTKPRPPSPLPPRSNDDAKAPPPRPRSPSPQHDPACRPYTSPPPQSPPSSPQRPLATPAPPQPRPYGRSMEPSMANSHSPSGLRRKRGLPSSPRRDAEGAPSVSGGAATASLLTPISTCSLSPFHFALPGACSLRLHRDGHLTLRLPHGTMRVYRQGLRVDACGSPQHTSTPHAAARQCTSHGGEEEMMMKTIRTFSLMELPLCWRPAYAYAARLVDHIRSRVPKVDHAVRARCRAGGLSCDWRLGGRRGAAVAKCMLMENGPLPDFLMRWVDGAQLSYQLRDGKLQLRVRDQPPRRRGEEGEESRGGSSVCYRWRLSSGLDGWPCSSSVCGSEGVSRYLAMAQHAMMRCLELEPCVAQGGGRTSSAANQGPAREVVVEGSGVSSSSSSMVVYEYLEHMVPNDPLTDVLGLSTRTPLVSGQTRAAGQQPADEARQASDGSSDDGASESHCAAADKSPRAASTTGQGAALPQPDTDSQPPAAAAQSASVREEVVPPRQLSVDDDRQQQQQQQQQQQCPPSPPAVPQEGGRVSVVAGVGRGWRDEASGALVVRFDDGAMVRLDQGAQVLTYRAAEEGEEEEQSFVLPGSSRQGQRVKIPREVRDRMKHLGEFLRVMQQRPSAR